MHQNRPLYLPMCGAGQPFFTDIHGFFCLPVPYLAKTMLIQINYAAFLTAESRLPTCQHRFRQGQSWIIGKLDKWLVWCRFSR